MKYPNAYLGVKRLVVSQILHILSSLTFFAGAWLLVLVPGELTLESNAPVYFCVLVLLLLTEVLSILAFVMQLTGLNRARKDERLFKKAMYFVIICAVCTLALLFGNGMFGRIASGIDEVSTLLVNVYLFLAIYNIADRLGDTAVQKRGKLALLLVTVMFGSAFVMKIVIAFIPDLIETAEILSAVSTAIEFIGNLVTLFYLLTAKKMLSKS